MMAHDRHGYLFSKVDDLPRVGPRGKSFLGPGPNLAGLPGTSRSGSGRQAPSALQFYASRPAIMWDRASECFHTTAGRSINSDLGLYVGQHRSVRKQ